MDWRSGFRRQESSAKLTNQRVSYAFTSSLLSFHARHILPTSKFPAYLFLYFTYLFSDISDNERLAMCDNCDCECEYSSLV